METLLFEITEAEERLRVAMLHNDVSTLTELISDRLLFAGPDGNLATKQDDLDAHRQRLLRLSKLDIGEPQLLTVTVTVVVSSVCATLAGTYAGTPINGQYRYTRVWSKEDGQWKIVAGQCAAVG